MAPERLDLASHLEFPAQSGQPALSPPSNSSPSPFMQFAASMASQGNVFVIFLVFFLRTIVKHDARGDGKSRGPYHQMHRIFCKIKKK